MTNPEPRSKTLYAMIARFGPGQLIRATTPADIPGDRLFVSLPPPPICMTPDRTAGHTERTH